MHYMDRPPPPEGQNFHFFLLASLAASLHDFYFKVRVKVAGCWVDNRPHLRMVCEPANEATVR